MMTNTEALFRPLISNSKISIHEALGGWTSFLGTSVPKQYVFHKSISKCSSYFLPQNMVFANS
jgi:hypothetical protein